MLKNPEKLSPYDYQKIPLTGSVMRNSRLRIFLYVLLGAALCCVVYLLKTTHSRFKEIENSREKCLQQRDSLSAQLQVVYEHKNRLEKSLQQEKIDHKHTKEEQDRQKNELHVRMEREKNKQQQLHSEIADLKNNYALLEEEKKQLVGAMSAQLESLKQQKEEEINKIKAHINQLILEKEDLQKNVENQMWRVKQHTDELQLCRLQYEQLENKLKELTTQLQRRSFIGENHNPGFIHLHQNNNKLKDNQYNDLQSHQALEQIKNHKNVDKSKNQQVSIIL
ncbi:Golgi integral membrane protein 4-like isoform X2 [Centruroides sculpturatus]|uniref:Golgi integral membrane protein 4-like isoform X2 n=1 Tax=Centruroides sculpturatus TaxID=218467 RepID=UPI000C6CE6E8|nr:Golgi integral membrane protein 4-like isoform X2 [Centruroides sculpturatus]